MSQLDFGTKDICAVQHYTKDGQICVFAMQYRHKGLSTQDPFPLRTDATVHGIRGEINMSRPGHNSINNMGLFKYGRIIKGGKNTCQMALFEDNPAFGSIGKFNLECKGPNSFDFNHIPIHDLPHINGAMGLGCCLFIRNCQFSSNYAQ
jgi:hypothetical protein